MYMSLWVHSICLYTVLLTVSTEFAKYFPLEGISICLYHQQVFVLIWSITCVIHLLLLIFDYTVQIEKSTNVNIFTWLFKWWHSIHFQSWEFRLLSYNLKLANKFIAGVLPCALELPLLHETGYFCVQWKKNYMYKTATFHRVYLLIKYILF